jgi:hypothetical protein
MALDDVSINISALPGLKGRIFNPFCINVFFIGHPAFQKLFFSKDQKNE